jgi:hypothetical protein
LVDEQYAAMAARNNPGGDDQLNCCQTGRCPASTASPWAGHCGKTSAAVDQIAAHHLETVNGFVA